MGLHSGSADAERHRRYPSFQVERRNLCAQGSHKIFIGATPWQQLRKRGFQVNVLENIQVAALTVNPYSPSGYSFDHRELLTAMREAVGDLPVIDVRYGEQD